MESLSGDLGTYVDRIGGAISKFSAKFVTEDDTSLFVFGRGDTLRGSGGTMGISS